MAASAEKMSPKNRMLNTYYTSVTLEYGVLTNGVKICIVCENEENDRR